ncbi:Forkhead box protein L1 [Coemansia sp. RSA 552]|nr:Forkhead box protein L1 [Coemansia sp. RSA 552]
MNSDYSTPTRSEQHSPVPLPADMQLAAPAAGYGLAPLDLPVSAVDMGSNPQLAYLKGTYPPRPFSPSSVDFAGMNITSGYPTPHSATPVAMPHSQPQSQQSASQTCAALEASAAGASVSATAPAPSAEKPEFSYASLIAQSLVEAPVQRRTLNGIYEWIQEHFPYYRTRQNWQNSIRHNLSLNKGFMKIKRDEAHPGKGSFWTFTPGYETCLNGGHFKPIRSRSGRAALAAAAAMAAAKNSADSPSAKEGAESKRAGGAAATEGKPAKKKTVRAIKSAKSLKRSHSVPPNKEHSAPPAQGSAAGDANTTAACAPSMSSMSDAMMPIPMAYSETAPVGMLTGHGSTKKMRVSTSQGHPGISCASSTALNSSALMYSQTPSFAPSPVPYMASPALMSTTPMSVVSTGSHTPLNQSGQFQFHMPSPCSVPLPMSAMDLASAPTAGGPYGIGGAFMGPPGTHIGDSASVGIDGAPLFGDIASAGSDGAYGTRRPSNLQPRVSWHGSESVSQAFGGHHPQLSQQRSHPNSLGMSIGQESVDMGLAMAGSAGHMSMDGHDTSAAAVDWSMLAGMPVPQAMPADMEMHTPHLHHMSSISTIDAGSSIPQGQQRSVDMSVGEHPVGPNNGQGIMTIYDEMLRDPSSIMNVFGQDLSGWQCPTKTNTIDPAALCAVDPETSSL